jgi:hypothetical protein
LVMTHWIGSTARSVGASADLVASSCTSREYIEPDLSVIVGLDCLLKVTSSHGLALSHILQRFIDLD